MDYNRALALANRLIEKNGTLVKLQRLSAAPADSTKPWKGAGVPTVEKTTTAKAVFLPVYGKTNLGLDFIDDELLKRCKEVALIAGQAQDLTTYNQFFQGAVTFPVQWVQVLKPADIALLYAFGVSR